MLKTKGGKIIIATVCAALLVAGSVMGTMAYLTSQDSVTNTFTVGQVGITMDETRVDEAGNPSELDGDRVKTNNYKLMPGHEYVKDPTIHVAAGSETCYLFVKLDNQIKDIVDNTTVEKQITDNGWTLLDGTSDVYYRLQDAVSQSTDVAVFGNFKVKGSVNNETLNNYAEKKINITAYAVQQDGFANAAAAWKATFGATQTTGTTEANN